jgi:hypothetical protein
MLKDAPSYAFWRVDDVEAEVAALKARGAVSQRIAS